MSLRGIMSGNMPATISEKMTDDMLICSECGKAVDRVKTCIIDEEFNKVMERIVNSA